MLQAQVNYWNMVETAKHNRAMEAIGADTLAETVRHQLKSEDLENVRNVELARHNKMSEALQTESNAAQALQAQASLQQARTQQNKVNYDYLLGTQNLQVARGQLGVQSQQADIAAYNAATQRKRLDIERDRNRLTEQQIYASVAQTGIQQLGKLLPTISYRGGQRV